MASTSSSSPSIRYSLWLTPRNPSPYAKLIQSASTITQTKPFPPHITLLGGIRCEDSQSNDTSEKVLGLVKEIVEGTEKTELELSLMSPTSSTTFFQAVTLPVASHDNLTDLQTRSVSALAGYLAGSGPREYLPHMSLAYGDLSEETRERAEKELGDGDGMIYTVGAVEVWRIVGRDTDDWSCVGKCEFP
ncbi:hypothetical protein HKX48_009116 [Thoreauomyces humboldtii]|nr:hypothetical protein HKX48_009116 [Thoreauomyces humboldtii]